MKVHFMGIAGSGMAPIALIAKSMGYEVSGCDISDSTYYSNALKENGIDMRVGHDESHLRDIDILAITPAVYDYNPDQPELLKAAEMGILMTWQEFSGKYLQKDKDVIAVCGTHGKSSTTAMVGLMMENAGLDPIVEAGTIIKEWGSGYRLADSNYFVCEADEFNNNFLHYHPSYIAINNVEMDHPEFFKDVYEVRESYVKFIMNLKNDKVLVANLDNEGVRIVIEMAKKWILDNNVQVYGYCTDLNNAIEWIDRKPYHYQISKLESNGSSFIVGNRTFHIGIMGEYNIQNAMSVFCLAQALHISDSVYSNSINSFHGISRRLEKKYDDKGVLLFDDYAHHPTEVRSVLETLKKVYHKKRLIAVFEPHQISRLKLFVDEFSKAFSIADEVIITKTFIGREVLKDLKPLDISILKNKVGDKLVNIEEFDDVVKYVLNAISGNEVIVVLGAGYSYKLTAQLNEALLSR